ncbi:MAG TPA: hypothetical protein VGN26_12570 [Armatimonadota bacterium]|jgi:hypothetical protein
MPVPKDRNPLGEPTKGVLADVPLSLDQRFERICRYYGVAKRPAALEAIARFVEAEEKENAEALSLMK